VQGLRGRQHLIVRMYLDTDLAEFVDTSRLVLFDTEAGRWKVEMNTGDFFKLKLVNLRLVEVMATVDGRDKELLLQGMQRIKVMVKEVEKLRILEDDVKLYAFVHIDNCGEARTHSAKNDAANNNVVCKKQITVFPFLQYGV
jgi:hypothetical protein